MTMHSMNRRIGGTAAPLVWETGEGDVAPIPRSFLEQENVVLRARLAETDRLVAEGVEQARGDVTTLRERNQHLADKLRRAQDQCRHMTVQLEAERSRSQELRTSLEDERRARRQAEDRARRLDESRNADETRHAANDELMGRRLDEIESTNAALQSAVARLESRRVPLVNPRRIVSRLRRLIESAP